MARVGDISTVISEVLGLPLPQVAGVAKALRLAGLIPAQNGWRGIPGGAEVVSEHAAAIRLGLAGSNTVQGAPEAVWRLSDLRLAGIVARSPSDDGAILEGDVTDGLLQRKSIPKLWLRPLIEVLATMIDHPASTDPHRSPCPRLLMVSRNRPLAQLIVAAPWAGPHASAIVVFAGTDQTEADIEAGNWPPPVETNPPHLEAFCQVPAAVLLALNAALNAGAADHPVNSAAVH
jgi:hypothetical protein